MMRFLSELRRRRVIRVAGLYAVGAWIATEVSATVLPLLQVPEKFVTGIVITLIVMFPVAMIMAWIYDVGPSGIRRTKEIDSTIDAEGRPGLFFHILLLILAMLVFGYALFYFGQTRALQALITSKNNKLYTNQFCRSVEYFANVCLLFTFKVLDRS